MKPLYKPYYKGLTIVIFGVLFHINWAKTLLWGDNTDKGIRRTHYFSIFLSQKTEDHSVLTFILGPINIMIGVV
jgi:hypothetical protein